MGVLDASIEAILTGKNEITINTTITCILNCLNYLRIMEDVDQDKSMWKFRINVVYLR